MMNDLEPQEEGNKSRTLHRCNLSHETQAQDASTTSTILGHQKTNEH